MQPKDAVIFNQCTLPQHGSTENVEENSSKIDLVHF